MFDSNDLVCVYDATSAAQAELIRTLLVSAGIRAVTGDTNTPFPGLPIAPSEVFVERADVSAARTAIQASQHKHTAKTRHGELAD